MKIQTHRVNKSVRRGIMKDKRTIVVVDPDISLVEDLQRRFLLEPDYKIIGISTSGTDGFAKIQSQQPDFAVIANPLPDTDAFQLLQSVANAAPQVRMIMSLESENPGLVSQCLQAGALHVLTKPYTADDLIEIIKRIETKPPAYSAQGQYQQPQGGLGYGAQDMGQTGGGSYSHSQFKNAMSQFANEQESRGRGSYQDSYPSGGFSPGFNPGGPGGYYNQEQQYAPQFHQQQHGPGFQGQGGGFNQFPQQPGPMMDGGHGHPEMGGGGFPPPQMPQQHMGMQGGQPGMGMPNRQQGGFRTLKQTIIAVNCPKGGVGKTTISKELAIAYANVKIGGQPLKVCLVDCDLDFGDVSSMLNLQPYPNIVHWTSDISQRLRENPKGQIRYTQQQIESKYLITHPTGLKILAAPTTHSDALNITEKEMEIVIDNLKTCDFDVIILDTGNNTKDYTLIALDKAQIILMVATLDLTTINDTTLLLNTLKSIQFPVSKIRLIINKMPKRDKDIDVTEISQVLGAPVIGIIPEFPRIRQLNNSGTPAMLGRDNEFSEAIRKIGNTIIPVFNRAIPPPGARGGKEKGGGLFSRFRKR